MIDRVAKRYEGFFLPYSTDIEFFGYGGNTFKEPIPVERLESMIIELSKNENIAMALPTEYIYSFEGEYKSLYLKSGSWSTDLNFDLWERDADNEILNKLCMEAVELYLGKEKKILSSKKRDRILKTLLLSLNSDGRGWTPLPEHRLFCYNKALEAKGLLS